MNSPLFNFFFPPKDMWGGSVEVPINLGEYGSKATAFFVAKYPGGYCIRVAPELKSDYYENSAKILVSVFEKEKLIGSFESTKADHVLYEDGVSLKLLKAPKDFPLRSEVRFEIVVIKSDIEFHKKYGKAVLKIEKDSDE